MCFWWFNIKFNRSQLIVIWSCAGRVWRDGLPALGGRNAVVGFPPCDARAGTLRVGPPAFGPPSRACGKGQQIGLVRRGPGERDESGVHTFGRRWARTWRLAGSRRCGCVCAAGRKPLSCSRSSSPPRTCAPPTPGAPNARVRARNAAIAFAPRTPQTSAHQHTAPTHRRRDRATPRALTRSRRRTNI